MLKKITLLLIAACLSAPALADTSDYMWNQTFSRKITKAEAGDKRAQYEVGNMYMKGQGTNINEKEAFTWFKKSADQGYKKAEYKLGFLYLNGKGTSKDPGEAFKWINRSANKGYGPAQYQMGRMYWTGTGTSRDSNRAVSWYKKAVDSGYSPAKNALKVAQDEIRSASSRAAPKPTPKKTVAVAKAAPAARNSGSGKVSNVDLVTRLRNSFWLNPQGKAAPYLPSAVNTCNFQSNKITCKSRPIYEVSTEADLTYSAESEISKFSGNNKFVISYRRNFLEVLPADLDDPDAKLPFQPGMEKTPTVLKCSVKSNNLIRCTDAKGKQRSYTRQP